MKRAKDQVERFTMLVSRAEARKLLSEAIRGGKRLHRRKTPADLRQDTPNARELIAELKAWGKQSAEAMLICFGEAGVAAVRKRPLGYTTLELAKSKLKRRLELLNEALKQTEELRKTTLGGLKKAQSEKPKRESSFHKRSRRTYKYDFCLSFAGENRSEARELYKLLTRRGAKVFYDFSSEQKHRLWGPDLTVALHNIYQYESRYCIMFTSAAYLEKKWTTHESKAARARELEQDGYILPIKLDDTEIPGSPGIKGFKDRRKHTRAEIAEVAMSKLREAHPGLKRLVQLSGTATGNKPRKTQTSTKARTSALVMLGEHFYRVVKYHETGGVVTVTIQIRDNVEKERFQHRESRPYELSTNTLPFAHKLGSGRLKIQKLEYIDEAGKSLISLSGQRETLNTRWVASGQGEEELSRLVRSVVFGEALPQHERYALIRFNKDTDKLLDKGVLKQLWEEWSGSKAEFAEAAKLSLTFLLSDLGLLDRISLVKIGPWRQQKLPISLKGVRDDAYTRNALRVDVNGELEFSLKSRKK